MDGKVYMVFNRNCFSKMKAFSKLGALQAVTYTVHRKCGSVKEMVRDSHAVTTHHMIPYGLCIRAISNEFG